MIFRAKESDLTVLRPRITPDPGQVAALQRRFDALNYQPENGFHRDLQQDRRMSESRGQPAQWPLAAGQRQRRVASR
jgi:hypothetical protein